MTFAPWLERQLRRPDAIGHLARYIEATSTKHEGFNTYGARLTHIIGACGPGYSYTEACYADVKAAYQEYMRDCALYDLPMLPEWIGRLASP